jgi:tRNA(Ile)-lysidine synthetase-like protein
MGGAELRQLLRDWAGEQESVAIAFSAGPDSLALARLAQEAGLNPTLLHVDHGTPAAAAGVAAAQRLAAELDLELRCLSVHVESQPRGFEAGARKARYAALETAFDGIIWLAHSRDDFIETIWLRLLSGSSPLFWATMSQHRGVFERPLLEVRRSALRPWGVGAFADPMNQEGRFDRVWLRQSGILERLDPDGKLADSSAGLGGRIRGLNLVDCSEPLHDLPATLRRLVIRAQLAAWMPEARPRQRFITELATAAARPSPKTRCFSVANRPLYLRGGRLLLNS